MKMGRFFGDLSLESGFSQFSDFLSAAQTIHVGKGTTFGLGKMRIKNGCKP
ncbi:CRISPR system precrRNA processing endoribonuclease RAMP protein Cas6 [candidate division KSB1 bacterium]|nr:CRISPR system precrRNA processing endoribonuclease RAMP protein Cas6 [candidate division KSB1 bacterium]